MQTLVSREGTSMPGRFWRWLYSSAIHPVGSKVRFLMATAGDPQLRRALRQVAPYTMVGLRRLINAWDLVKRADAEDLRGAIVECGVFKGGSSGLMAAASPMRKIWLFDSFEGLPEPTVLDGAEACAFAGGRAMGVLRPIDQCVGTLDTVQELFFDVLHVERDRVEIRKGWFQETLPEACRDIGPIAVLRLDGDWYDSTRVCLEYLHDLVVPGGFVIIDDYGYWEGCRRAVDEFLAERRPSVAPETVAADASAIWWQVPR
jgi:O-methyltransferase